MDHNQSPVTHSHFPEAVELSQRLLNVIQRAGKEITNGLDFNETLNRISDVLSPDLCNLCSIWVFNSAGQLFETINTNKEIDFNFEDLVHSAHVSKEFGIIHLKNERSVLLIPLRIRNVIHGILACYDSHHIFNKIDLIVAEDVVSRGCLAFENTIVSEELKHSEDYLIKTRQMTEIANQSKSLFLANMSHEIRTPLSAILGFTELILADQEKKSDVKSEADSAPNRSQHLFERVKANGAHLLKLIDQILDLTKIESGKIEIYNEPVLLERLMNEVCDTLGLLAKRRKNTLDFHLPTNIPIWVQTDPTRLKQILINIIGNGLKFTENGTVQVNISYDEKKSELGFEVKDNGIGLTHEQILKIFNPFEQGDISHSKRFGGTGLGLSLSRRFAQHMNGDIILLNSAPNAGTTFKITVQAEDVSKSKESVKNYADQLANLPVSRNEDLPLSGAHILLAEDSPDNQLIVQMILEKAGAKVSVAYDGSQAFHMALKKDYDVLLLDIRLPVMSGHAVCQKLRAMGYQRPIIALTAHALKKERDLSLQYGCDEHLTKPIDRYLLISTIQTYVAMNRTGFTH